MLTLLFMSRLEFYQYISGWITLSIDILTTIMYIYYLVKKRNITLKDIVKLLKNPKKSKRLSKEIKDFIKTCENDENNDTEIKK